MGKSIAIAAVAPLLSAGKKEPEEGCYACISITVGSEGGNERDRIE